MKTRDRIVFRRIVGSDQIIAFLPDASANPGCVMSYMHVGQHGEATLEFYRTTLPCTTLEASALLRDLQGRGYDVYPMRQLRFKHPPQPKMVLPSVNCAHGAPMGRHGNCTEPDAAIRFRLVRLPFSDGCYDRGGAYWGSPANVYWARGDGETEVQETFVRANSRKAAKDAVREQFPNATFWR